ncbi:uncharacterized protein YbjT (DUF2867 family) [Actinoalloteichus hoggarensis]|uniref:NAD(P)H azoreductase n=1 Tax=Actinoalloteichus hoggarensis TaxID=1470176 RepID=A0A221W3L8_9PSEU|nr:NAD(P)H-binding protein [Actinoalloteichus hoggarensis]ASO20462.1 NAD(P)H azoreductase [Actinoalloteichus hoggarensis]MBB5923502.1 uncharacterized protein YbjT (DUF2867 family) [Actinoalloteichus hoggarensis]
MRILVTGGTGNIGRLVVDELVRSGATEVRVLTVDPVRAALPPEVEVVEGYLGRVETMPKALEGVDRLYLAPLPKTVAEVMRLAASAGVERVVDVAGPAGTWWYGVEEAVERSGVAWTHLEPGEFMTNRLSWVDQIRDTGRVRDAYPESAGAAIALEDVAAVAAAVLLQDGHLGRTYSLTGPETLTRAEMLRCIGRVLGRDIPYEELSHGQAVEMYAATMGDYARWYVDGMADLAAAPHQATSTFRDLMGRTGTTFAEWATANADSFR